MKIDFHIHTEGSIDSGISPVALLRKSKEFGIIPAVTDHNSISSHKDFRKLKAKFIPGEEIKTDVGDLIGLYLQELIPKNTPFLEALDQIKEQGGLTYLPHGFDPLRYNLGNKYPEFAKKVQIIEVFNPHCVDGNSNLEAYEFAKKNKKLMAVGSDSHFLYEFGKTYTELPEFDLEAPNELLKALKKATFITKGIPLYIRGLTTLFSKGKKFSGKVKRLIFKK